MLRHAHNYFFFRQSLNNTEKVLLSDNLSANNLKQKHGPSSKLKETKERFLSTILAATGTSKSPCAELGFH